MRKVIWGGGGWSSGCDQGGAGQPQEQGVQGEGR